MTVTHLFTIFEKRPREKSTSKCLTLPRGLENTFHDRANTSDMFHKLLTFRIKVLDLRDPSNFCRQCLRYSAVAKMYKVTTINKRINVTLTVLEFTSACGRSINIKDQLSMKPRHELKEVFYKKTKLNPQCVDLRIASFCYRHVK